MARIAASPSLGARACTTPVTAAFLLASLSGAVAVAAFGGGTPAPAAVAGLAGALVLTVLSGLLAPVLLSPPWRDGITPLVSMLPAALLHLTAGPSGADDLPILAVAWIGLVGTRRQVVASLVVLAAQRLVLPVPAGEVVAAQDRALSVAVVAVAATVVLIVNTWARERDRRDARLAETTDLLGEVAAATRAVRTGQAGRAELCEAARRMARVQRATLVEPDEHGRLRTTVATDHRDLGLRLPADATSAAVLADGARRFAADPVDLGGADPVLLRRLGASSVLWEPVVHGGTVLAVLVIAWRGRVEQPTPRAGRAAELIADELGALLHSQRLADRAQTDELTGLPNRRVWHERAGDVLSRRRSAPDDVVVALLDLDHFKAYNDRLGHARGDDLLAEFARRATAELRRTDVLIRWGGEEFVALLPGCSPADAGRTVERLRAVVPDGQTCSAGLAQWDGREDSAGLLARADRALYRAKARGRDRLVLDADPAPPVLQPGTVTGPEAVSSSA